MDQKPLQIVQSWPLSPGQALDRRIFLLAPRLQKDFSFSLQARSLVALAVVECLSGGGGLTGGPAGGLTGGLTGPVLGRLLGLLEMFWLIY